MTGRDFYARLVDVAHQQGYRGMPEFEHAPDWVQWLMEHNGAAVAVEAPRPGVAQVVSYSRVALDAVRRQVERVRIKVMHR